MTLDVHVSGVFLSGEERTHRRCLRAASMCICLLFTASVSSDALFSFDTLSEGGGVCICVCSPVCAMTAPLAAGYVSRRVFTVKLSAGLFLRPHSGLIVKVLLGFKELLISSFMP